jgi:hypothetical protein
VAVPVRANHRVHIIHRRFAGTRRHRQQERYAEKYSQGIKVKCLNGFIFHG